MRKLTWFTLGFALATVLGVYWLSPERYLFAAGISAVILAVALVVFLRHPQMKLTAVVMLGCILGFLWQLGYDSLYLSSLRHVDGKNGQFTICATDYTKQSDYGPVVEGYIQLEGKPYRVRAYLPDEMQLAPGDSVTGLFTMNCTLPGGGRDSGYYRSDGTFLVAYPVTQHEIQPAPKLPWYGYPAAAGGYIAEIIDQAFAEDVSGFARALLLGDTELLDHETDTAFKRSGIRHIVAVSGLHVTILFSIIFLLTGKRKILSCVLGLPALLFFAAVAGFSPSITRACIMHGLMSVGFLLKREYDPPTALSFAVLVMLLVNPWTAPNVGFQLSVGCVTGILLFAQPIQDWVLDTKRLGKYKGPKGKLCRWFAMSVSVSLAATVITTPLCALYFGLISLVSVVTNLLTLWIISFVFYGIVLVCLLGAVWLPLATAVAWVVALGMRYVLWLAKLLSGFPLAAVYTKSVLILIWLGLCYVFLGIFLARRRKRPLLLGCSCFLTLCVALILSWMLPLRDECRVTVLDVGQGQCILLQSEGKNYLVDCGGDSDTAAADEAAALLLSQGIFRLDGLILTHYDADHAAGAIHLLRQIPADRVYLPECLDSEGYGAQITALAGENGCVVGQAFAICYGNASITLIPSEFGMTDNESGLCVLFQTENYDILITGDRSMTGEKELLRQIPLPELELLIVGHHGSKYSTSEALLAATQPEMAIISVSAHNSFGHPTEEVLERLRQYGCEIYRTDQDGTVLFRG